MSLFKVIGEKNQSVEVSVTLMPAVPWTASAEEILNTLSGASPLQADLAEVRGAGERLTGIADQLLAFTRRKADEATSLDATSLVREVAASSGTLPEGIKLTVSAAEAVWVRAAHDQLKMELTRLKPAFAKLFLSPGLFNK